MTLRVRSADPASEELEAAIRWYETQRKGLGAEFYAAVVDSVDLIKLGSAGKLLASIGLLSITACYWFDMVEDQHFDTIQDAVGEGRLVGFLPPGIPDSCRDVYIRFDHDSEWAWARITCANQDIRTFVGTWELLDQTAVPSPEIRSGELAWWDSRMLHGHWGSDSDSDLEFFEAFSAR